MDGGGIDSTGASRPSRTGRGGSPALLRALIGVVLAAALGIAAPATATTTATATPQTDVTASAATAAAVSPTANPWVQIAPGDYHTCGLHTDGSVQCWGSNQWGESTVPAGPFTQIAVGARYSCGLRPDGTVSCWGQTPDTATPTGTWTQLVAHDAQTCGIHPDGQAQCWGAGPPTGEGSPTGVTGLGPATRLVAGDQAVCAISPTAGVGCQPRWDGNRNPAPPGPWVDVAVGGTNFACGVRADGGAECWGGNDAPGTGLKAVPPGPWLEITAGGSFACGLHPGGSAECWGWHVPTPPAGTWAHLEARNALVCGVGVDGSGACWGDNSMGKALVPGPRWQQLDGACGVRDDGAIACVGGTQDTPPSPPADPWVQTSGDCALGASGTATCSGTSWVAQNVVPDGTWTAISVTWYQFCGIRPDGSAQCWIDGLATNPLVLTGTWTKVSAGAWHGCGIHTDGTGECWGHPTWGNTNGRMDIPAGTWTDVSAGETTTCGVHPGGAAECWGDTTGGKATVPAGTWSDLEADWDHTCGIRTSGAALCWGGQFIFGAPNAPAGVTFASLAHWTACGIDTGGAVRCWPGASTALLPPVTDPGPAPPTGSRFTALTPVRVLDSRTTVGGWNGPLGSGDVHTVPVAGANGVPVDATAVVFNVTVTEGTDASYLTAQPAGTITPTAANLLFAPDQTVAGHVTVPLGSAGGVAFANQLGTVHVVADLVGFYRPDRGPTDGSLFTAATPTRILDSRTDTGGWVSTPLHADETRPLPIAGVAGVPPTATAAVFNLTATGGTADTYVQAFPTGAIRADTANLLVAAGQTLPNLVTVGIGAGGSVSLYNQLGDVDLVADLVGWYDPTAGQPFHPIAPTRLLDSRDPLGPFGGPVGPGEAKTLAVTALDGGAIVPPGATALVGNLTATGGTAPTYVAAGPTPSPLPAPTASLLADAGQTIPNAVTTALSVDGDLDLFNQQGTVDLVLDATGWFGP